ncbi:hypothetical protein PVAND_015998 [Polypedilum vanderplanki]|uniref:Reverse transcriptase domain-containing protein n=1 Tax=Polypedilum vanderplanki TaxID=319348 RepID=A0A9J6BDT8_POLVA|nr:hypothetical protein PVAND_015998 [Polypedilum vanderplanki]
MTTFFTCNQSVSSNSILLIPPDEDEIKEVINSLPNSASGYDGISTNHAKVLVELLSPLFVHLITTIFDTGIYPDCFKTAIVIPICKTNDTSNVHEYRPISILPIFNKIIEKVIFKRVINFLNTINYLSPYQYGFRHKSCTETAAIDMITAIQHDIDKGRKVSLILMDLSSAFDIVDRQKLLNVIESAGIRGVAAKLIESYLSNRHQICKIGTSYSKKINIDHGVIQGSVLGPLLFNIYINNITNLRIRGKIYLYADDIALVNSHSPTEPIENVVKSDVEVISSFLTSRRLVLNPNKTQFMIIHSIYKKIKLENSITLENGQILKRVENAKHLGLHIDQHLKFDYHVTQLILKVSRVVGILWKLRKYPLITKINIYRTLIHSHLEYMNTIWGTASNAIIDPLQILQNRALRFVYQLDKRTSRVLMYTKLVDNIIPIRAINYIKAATFVHNVTHRNIHSNTTFLSAPYNSRSLRVINTLKQSISNTNYGRKNITSHGVKLYNKIPNQIREFKDAHRFKRVLKRHIINNDFIADCFNNKFFN